MLIVAIDAAKFYQKVLVCNYFGDVLIEPTFFGVNKKGITTLHEKIEKVKEEINAERIFVGIEATGHYYEDVVRELGALGYGVTIINGATTFEERARVKVEIRTLMDKVWREFQESAGRQEPFSRSSRSENHRDFILPDNQKFRVLNLHMKNDLNVSYSHV